MSELKISALTTIATDHESAATIATIKTLRLPPLESNSRRSEDFTYAGYDLLHRVSHVLDSLSEMRSRAS